MTMGEKLRAARLAAGLSQRQLCEGIVTRNMLSQLENGSAQPSLATLQALAQRLGQPVHAFLEEPEQDAAALRPARQHFAEERYRQALDAAQSVDSWESHYLQALCALELARQQLRQGQMGEAQRLLEACAAAAAHTPYYTDALEQQRLLLLARVVPGTAVQSYDEPLLALAAQAVFQGEQEKAGQLLAAVQETGSDGWHFVTGCLLCARKQYTQAVPHLCRGENWNRRATWEQLEICCRETGDFAGAYHYACRLREHPQG